MAARHMDDIGAADIAVGQVWRCDVVPASQQHRYRVTAVHHDRVTVEHVDTGLADCVSFGTFLSLWVLVEEAPAQR